MAILVQDNNKMSPIDSPVGDGNDFGGGVLGIRVGWCIFAESI